MPRKGENIYKRKDGRWEARYIKQRNTDGKALYGYVYAKSYKEVKIKLSKQLINPSPGIAKPKNIQNDCGISFHAFAKEWYMSILPQVKESTGNKYDNILTSYIIPGLGDLPISDITPDVVEAHMNHLLITGGKKCTGLSPKTVSDVLSVIRNIMKYAYRVGITHYSNFGSIKIKQHPKEMRILSQEEQARLCQYICSDTNAYNLGILVSLFTGIRLGELCALRWEDISLEDQTIYIHQTLQRVQSKSGEFQKTKIIITPPKSMCSIRTIPIPECLVDILSKYKSVDIGYVLTNSDTHYIEPRTMQNRFKLALKQSSVISTNFHTLRHTFATRCIELGFDVKSLSEILGHASVNITMNRYVHPSFSLKKENMNRLSDLFSVK